VPDSGVERATTGVTDERVKWGWNSGIAMFIEKERVRELSADFGIELSDDEIASYVDRAEEMESSLGHLRPDPPDSEGARGVVVADDEYNAFRYRFTTDGGDGPLSNLSVAVKDNISVAGVPMTCGSDTLEFTPSHHATVVRQLLSSGADLVGTTNMDELALYTTGETCAHGRTLNPRVDGCVPGGSSSGSGAAVAAGLMDIAIGSDTGGSVRIPASFCGVVGFKPTHRSVSRCGYADLAPSLDHLGPIADSVETAARALEAIGGRDVRDPSTKVSNPPTDIASATTESPAGLQIAEIEEALELSDDVVADAVSDTTRALADEGVSVDSISIDGYEDTPFVLPRISGAEFATYMEKNGLTYGTGTGYSEEWRAAVEAANETGEYGENVTDRLVPNSALLAATGGQTYATAQTIRQQFTARVSDALDRYDALICPTTAMLPPEFGAIDEREDVQRTVANTAPFNLTGHPALSVPCGEVDGNPVGIQIVADWNDEATAVTLGSAVERL
jgi:Asp-tRNA(Asn)/Glu-tRNA(Gln) amidotransferase A subunit family amidase